MLSRVVHKKQRGRRLATAIATLAIVAGTLLTASTALAVHDAGIFQLDKNASTAVNPLPIAAEDWDLICKANPTSCTFVTGYSVPSGTTTATSTVFKTDPSESSKDDILKGGTKDGNDIDSWKWASAKPSPPKNDITNGYVAEYTATTAAGNVDVGDRILYFGADRLSNSGSANIAFWFFQHNIAKAGQASDGTCAAGAGCPWTGTHTVGNVSLGGTTPGDILVISAFGPKAAINVYEWVGPGNATVAFSSNRSLQPLLEGGQACEDVTIDNACATVNDVVTASPWTVPQKGAANNSFQPTNFFEGGLNLTKLKVDACISTFVINTRASASGDAELHDVITGKFDRCEPALTTKASTNATDIVPGTAGMFDTATITVTGATNPADAAGSIKFFLCPDATKATCTNQVGSAITLNGADCSPVSSSATDGISCAKSGTTDAPADPGTYCWRAEATLTNYDSPGTHSFTDECFTVAQIATSISTAQKWLPQDSATITPAVAGTVVFSLYENGDCSGTAARTFTDSDSSDGFATDNSTYYTVSKTISWSATFTPTDTAKYSGSTTTKCEKSELTINNSASDFPPPTP